MNIFMSDTICLFLLAFKERKKEEAAFSTDENVHSTLETIFSYLYILVNGHRRDETRERERKG